MMMLVLVLVLVTCSSLRMLSHFIFRCGQVFWTHGPRCSAHCSGDPSTPESEPPSLNHPPRRHATEEYSWQASGPVAWVCPRYRVIVLKQDCGVTKWEWGNQPPSIVGPVVSRRHGRDTKEQEQHS